jgi:hypothetical protein
MYFAWPEFRVIAVCSLKFIIIIITFKLQNCTQYHLKAYCKTNSKLTTADYSKSTQITNCSHSGFSASSGIVGDCSWETKGV